MTKMEWYWLGWIVVGFAVPETIALATGRYKDTLSETVWDWFGVMKAQSISQWSVQHYVLAVFCLWLAGHMVFRIWR